MNKLKLSVSAALVCFFSFSFAAAHPPQEIIASYNIYGGILDVSVFHETERSGSHYIKWITAFSGETRAMQEFSKQGDEKVQRTSFYFPGMATGTVIGIRAECSIWGIKEEAIVVELPEKKTEIEFSTFERGSYSGINREHFIIVSNHNELEDLWGMMYSHHYPVPDIPEIDFENTILAAVFMGEKSTGGYSVNIDNIYLKNGRLHVLYSFSEPSPDSIVTQAITSPFHIVMFPVLHDIKETVFEEHRR